MVPVDAGRDCWLDRSIGALQPKALLEKYRCWFGGSLAPVGLKVDDWRNGILHLDFLEHIGLDVGLENRGDHYMLEVSRYNDRLGDPEGAERAIKYLVEDGGWDTRCIAESRRPPACDIAAERRLQRSCFSSV